MAYLIPTNYQLLSLPDTVKTSAVIITLNEERNIGRCLSSLNGVVDEIVVVDNGSKDRTQAICEEHGARFIHQKWLGYGQQKNLANEQATGDYILSLDADEELSEKLKTEVLRVKAEEGLNPSVRPIKVYGFNRLTNYCGKWVKHGGWYPDKKIRLFPKGTAKWNENKVHEDLELIGDPEVIWLKGDLLHYSYYTIEEHEARAKKYAELGAQKLIDRKKKNLGLKAILSPIVRFIKMYIIQGGFLDGKAGYHIARITSKEVKMKYRMAAKMQREK